MTHGHARVVVDLAPGAPRHGSLQAAAALADRVGAELVGIFIEDLDLLRFAALPFALEIGFASAQRRRLEVTEVERSLRALALEAQRALASTAERSAVRWSFRVARGLAPRELLAAATGSATEAVMRDLRLLLLGDGASAATLWAEAARERLAADTAAMRLSVVHAADLDELARTLSQEPHGVVLLQGDERLLSQHGLQALLRDTGASVLILPARAATGRTG